jgi:hypothetical protein
MPPIFNYVAEVVPIVVIILEIAVLGDAPSHIVVG